MRHVKLSALLAFLLTGCGQGNSEPTIKFPKWWEVYKRMTACLERVFECDYTTKTCKSGYHGNGFFAGVILAEDRKTVVAHVGCGGDGVCYNFDTGEATYAGVREPAFDLKGDASEDRVEAWRRNNNCTF